MINSETDPAAAHLQRARAQRFAALHDRATRTSAFVIPNPWDVGSARLLAAMGFEALATTGAGFAFSSGHQDGRTAPSVMFDHVASIASATTLPVSADLEDGFGDDPADVTSTITTIASRGAVGGSIEDRSYARNGVREFGSLYDLGHAVERIAAAAEAARALPFRFTLTARCECFLVGRPDIGETVRRLQAYQEAGADVLYAPGLATRSEIMAVTSSVDRPVNVVMGLVPETFTIDELTGMGVARISLGSTLARAAIGALVRAGEEMLEARTFGFAADAIPYSRIDALLAAVA